MKINEHWHDLRLEEGGVTSCEGRAEFAFKECCSRGECLGCLPKHSGERDQTYNVICLQVGLIDLILLGPLGIVAPKWPIVCPCQSVIVVNGWGTL